MKIALVIELWMIPSVFLALGVFLLMLSLWMQKGQPKFHTSECVILPNFKGTTPFVLGVVCIVFSIVFLVGHYIA